MSVYAMGFSMRIGEANTLPMLSGIELIATTALAEQSFSPSQPAQIGRQIERLRRERAKNNAFVEPEDSQQKQTETTWALDSTSQPAVTP